DSRAQRLTEIKTAPHADTQTESGQEKISRERNRGKIKDKRETHTSARRRGNAKTGKNACAPRRRARCVIRSFTFTAACSCRSNTSSVAPTKNCPSSSSRRPSAGCDRKVGCRGRPGVRASAIAAAAQIRVLAVVAPIKQLSISYTLSH